MNIWKKGLFVAGVATVLTAGIKMPAQAFTTIDTASSWDGSLYVSPFGESLVATIGQTFTVGSDNIMNSFSFYLDGYDDPDTVDFAAYVMGWDGAKATGPILYQSGPQSTTLGANFESFVFNTGNLALSFGQQYVAFLSASSLFDNVDGTSRMGFVFNNYSDGDMVYLDNRNNFSALTASNWSILYGLDAATTMQFSSATNVPTPAAVLPALFGMLGAATRKKKEASSSD